MPSRVVRGEINASRSLSRVSMEADLTFRALVVAVDDYGRLDADPLMLKAVLFPRRPEVTVEKLEAWIAELGAEGCVQLYQADGGSYLCLTGWEKHRGNGRRAGASRFPGPDSPGGGEPIQDRTGAARSAQEIPRKSRKSETPPETPGNPLLLSGDEKREARSESVREPPAAERAEPRSPLLRVLSKLPGSEAEKIAWLADEGVQAEIDAEAAGKPVVSFVTRYYRRYLKGDRVHENAALEAERAAKRRAWEAAHGEAYRLGLEETGGVA